MQKLGKQTISKWYILRVRQSKVGTSKSKVVSFSLNTWKQSLQSQPALNKKKQFFPAFALNKINFKNTCT